MFNSNPRVTLYHSTTKEENNAVKIMSEFRNMQNPTLHYILCKINECNILKHEA